MAYLVIAKKTYSFSKRGLQALYNHIQKLQQIAKQFEKELKQFEKSEVKSYSGTARFTKTRGKKVYRRK